MWFCSCQAYYVLSLNQFTSRTQNSGHIVSENLFFDPVGFFFVIRIVYLFVHVNSAIYIHISLHMTENNVPNLPYHSIDCMFQYDFFFAVLSTECIDISTFNSHLNTETRKKIYIMFVYINMILGSNMTLHLPHDITARIHTHKYIVHICIPNGCYISFPISTYTNTHPHRRSYVAYIVYYIHIRNQPQTAPMRNTCTY